ncbi:MAG: 2-oxo acid dehydrogenase subunit E2 [Betaproteobacteria bacterium]|nr:2-oxo acid dehydrogenase subunit E2 [Betaproteobacteria bacterium]
MGIHVIKMPDIGEGIAEVELAEWYVKVGDTVAEDQTLADVMTDKATVEIPSAAAGKVLALGGKVGDVLAVGAELIRIEVEGAGNLKEGTKAAAPSAQPAPAAPSTAIKPAASPALAPAPKPAASAPAPASQAPAGRPLASPAVRQRAREAGVDLHLVRGTGPEGRITQEDVDAYAASPKSPSGSDGRYAERHDETAIPVVGLRRKIAQKMQESKRHIPHFTYVEEVDVTELEALRVRLNDQFASARGKLTLLPFIMRAVVLGVRQFPQVNARYDDTADVVTRYGAVHLGIATQTEAGLMVPVVRHAEAKDLWASAAEVARLADAARRAKATRDELLGSTITITSLGALGGIVSTPVINHPEVAIVGINRIVERPMFQGAAVVPRKLMNLSSSFDHRVVDGQHAAEFVQTVRGFLECPATLFVE